MKLEYNGMCFACGKDNPIGLRLEFIEEGDIYRTEFTPQEVHQGFGGIFHGGIMSTLLDETMGRSLVIKGIHALTVELTIRLKKAVKIGDRLIVESRIKNNRGRLVEMEAWAKLENGTIMAEAKGKFIKIKL